jgi:hypothetical protein
METVIRTLSHKCKNSSKVKAKADKTYPIAEQYNEFVGGSRNCS